MTMGLKHPRITIRRDAYLGFYWLYQARNGRIVAASEQHYLQKAAALRNAMKTLDGFDDATVRDLTGRGKNLSRGVQ